MLMGGHHAVLPVRPCPGLALEGGLQQRVPDHETGQALKHQGQPRALRAAEREENGGQMRVGCWVPLLVERPPHWQPVPAVSGQPEFPPCGHARGHVEH